MGDSGANMTARCIGYKYKTFRKNCSWCGVSFAARTRKYLVNYGNKYMTDVLCSKLCRDMAIEMYNGLGSHE